MYLINCSNDLKGFVDVQKVQNVSPLMNFNNENGAILFLRWLQHIVGFPYGMFSCCDCSLFRYYWGQ